MSSLAKALTKTVTKTTDIKKPVVLSGIKVATRVITNTIKVADLSG